MIKHPIYDRGNIYLSGGMQYVKDLGAGWRKTCSQKLKEMKYFPIDICDMDRAYAAKHGELYNMLDTSKHLQYKSNFRRHFIWTDVELVRRDSDAVIVLYDEGARRGAGTISECQISYESGVPLFVMSAYEEWWKEVPGWLQGLSTKIFTEFDDLYDYLNKLPYGILKRDVYGNHGSKQEYLCSLCGNVFQKTKHHFVSKVTPLYCKGCVDLVTTTYEEHVDRYGFFLEHFEEQQIKEMKHLEEFLSSQLISRATKLEQLGMTNNADTTN